MYSLSGNTCISTVCILTMTGMQYIPTGYTTKLVLRLVVIVLPPDAALAFG